MKAWQVNEWCEPEQMTLADIPLPEPNSGEVRIRNITGQTMVIDGGATIAGG